jgi:PLP dependent protein
MIEYQDFILNVEELKQRVLISAERSGRSPESIRILPVTKTFPIEAVEFCVRSGFDAVGENRVQEVLEKQGDFRKKIRWELIGHLQSNKVRSAVEHFDCIQSVDSPKLMEKIQRIASDHQQIVDILLQFNTGNDPDKHGMEPGLADSAVEFALKCDHLRLKGFMTIAPLSDDPSVARRTFARLRQLLERINRDFSIKMEELSMGMTGDLDSAIMEGSTCIRIGTALFGARPVQNRE